eukprot:m.28818 g.28818  ORF g.28818 m.28818 type:complete len:328 (+) comp4601_c0_seq1:1027-2010(+)
MGASPQSLKGFSMTSAAALPWWTRISGRSGAVSPRPGGTEGTLGGTTTGGANFSADLAGPARAGHVGPDTASGVTRRWRSSANVVGSGSGLPHRAAALRSRSCSSCQACSAKTSSVSTSPCSRSVRSRATMVSITAAQLISRSLRYCGSTPSAVKAATPSGSRPIISLGTAMVLSRRRSIFRNRTCWPRSTGVTTRMLALRRSAATTVSSQIGQRAGPPLWARWCSTHGLRSGGGRDLSRYTACGQTVRQWEGWGGRGRRLSLYAAYMQQYTWPQRVVCGATGGPRQTGQHGSACERKSTSSTSSHSRCASASTTLTLWSPPSWTRN